MENKFFYRYWWLYYLLFFLLLGLLIYAILWKPKCNNNYYQPPVTTTPSPPMDNEPPTMPPAQGATVNCDTEVNSGGQGLTRTPHLLGSQSGKVVVQYDMYDVPDQLTVYYDGKVVATTSDLVSGYGTVEFAYKAEQGKPQECIVEMKAPEDGTAWTYRVNCPE